MVYHRVKIFTVILFASSLLFSQVIISEVMYDLDGSDSPNEFVELYNTSTTITYDLTNWTISDSYSTDDFTDAGFGLLLPPQSYAVIFEGDYNIASGIYSSIVPGSALVLKVDDNSIGNSLSTSDSLYIKDNTSATHDSYKWTNTASDGFSLEKIRLENPNTSDNWSESKDSLGTPGGENSVAPLPIDGAISGDVLFNPKYSNPMDTIKVKIPVSNNGLNNISGEVNIYFNSILVGAKAIHTLNQGQSTIIEIEITGFPSGRHLLNINYDVLNDNNLDNNSISKQLDVSHDFGIVQINEFLAKNSVYQSEFIELVSLKSFTMAGWKIADKTSPKIIPPTPIKSGDYIILANNNSLFSISNPSAHYLLPYDGLPTLNNSSDTIYLLDNTNTVIDSLAYGSGWPIIADTSAEKLRPELISDDLQNWKTSDDTLGITPGFKNSTFLVDFEGEIIDDLIAKEPPFPKNNEVIQLTIPITNNGAEQMSGNLTIYNVDDMALKNYTVSNIGYRDTVGFVFELPPMSSGVHPLKYVLEIADDSNLANNTVADTVLVSYNFGDVLINEFLPGPTSTQAEFIELQSNTDVTLHEWSIEDATRNAKIFNSGNVTDETLIVLSEDNAFGAIIPTEAVFVEVEDFPSLNNYGDAIILRDFTGTIIDSLIYTTWWELETGISTEKIHPQLTSTDSTAWLLSVDTTGMTPGRTNSVVVKNVDGAILQDDIYTSPEHPEENAEFQLIVPVLNNGLEPISGRISIEQEDVEISNFNINNIDTGVIFECTLVVESMPSGINSMKIILEIDGDEDIADISCEYNVKISYQFGDVAINEFCADPEAPLFEFIELYTLKNIDLYGWMVSDNRKDPVSFGNHNIGQDTYIILSEEAEYDMNHLNAVYYPIDNFPSLNNSGDGIFLYDFNGKIIDSLIYDNSNWSMESGLSTEKIFPSYVSDNSENWQVCTDPLGATIGLENSALLQTINGTILASITSHYPEFPHPSESIALNIGLKNTGIDIISGMVRLMYDGTDIGSADFNNLSSQDTTIVSLNIDPLSSGYNQIDIILEVQYDMNSGDNQISKEIFVSYPFGAVMINEFLAKPDTTQAEFVEIIGFSDIDLTGWSISDDNKNQHFFNMATAYANQPVVITADSAFVSQQLLETKSVFLKNGWPTLNNESDAIYIFDVSGTVVDSLIYTSDWPITEGRSTEKYRPKFESNDVNRWGIAVNSASMTPGQQNSIYFDELPKEGSMVFEQNPFSPDGDGVDDELLIQYKLPFEQGIIKLQIFDVTGRIISTPYWNVYFPQEGRLRWDGLRDSGEQARIGIYILRLSARNPSNSDTWEKVKTVVLAKQL